MSIRKDESERMDRWQVVLNFFRCRSRSGRPGRAVDVLHCIQTYHNRQRPHQGINNLIPPGYEYLEKPADPEDVRCESMLGGMLNHYYVKKAA